MAHQEAATSGQTTTQGGRHVPLYKIRTLIMHDRLRLTRTKTADEVHTDRPPSVTTDGDEKTRGLSQPQSLRRPLRFMIGVGKC